MKNIIKISSIILLISILASTLLLTYCTNVKLIWVDPAYTGGQSRYPRRMVQWWWVETYDECVDAVEQLKKHGSEFDTSAIFSCESENYDVKYCFKLNNTQLIKYGWGNPFATRNQEVDVIAFLFFDDVKIDDLAYGSIRNYEFCYFKLSDNYIKTGMYTDIDVADLSYENVFLKGKVLDSMDFAYRYTEQSTNDTVFEMVGYEHNNVNELSQDDINAILDSIVIIDNN